MTKSEVEAFLRDFDEALVQAFPGPEPMRVLLVGGACLLLQGITAQPTDSVEVIIVEMLGSQEHTLVGARVREVTESSRLRVVRRCLLCYAVRGTGLH